jgi:DNA-binding NarL/FixJ family response regulator
MEKLSRRERQVADAAARGLSNRQIAAELQISSETVKRHLSSIYAKLALPGRVVLAIHVLRSRGEGAAMPSL